MKKINNLHHFLNKNEEAKTNIKMSKHSKFLVQINNLQGK